jgi:hypothetical protein
MRLRSREPAIGRKGEVDMKRTVFGAIVLVMLVTAPGFAQVSLETEMTVQVLMEEWDTIIEKTLDLTREEKAAFWPLYVEYDAALAPLRERRVALIQKLTRSGGELTDAEIIAAARESFAIDEERAEVRKTYLAKFADVLPVSKVARLIQVENKLMALVNYQLAKDTPMVR